MGIEKLDKPKRWAVYVVMVAASVILSVIILGVLLSLFPR
jgi:hypothetical protein